MTAWHHAAGCQTAPIRRIFRLPGRQPPEVREPDLDDEVATGLLVRGGVTEALNLVVLRGQVTDRVADEVNEPERAPARAVGKSPAVTVTRSAPGLARSRATIACDRSIPWTRTPRALRGRRDAARAGAELQGARLRRAALGRERGEEVRRGPGHRARTSRVGPGGDASAEVVGAHQDTAAAAGRGRPLVLRGRRAGAAAPAGPSLGARLAWPRPCQG